jgi:sodium transport system ATP-binding protein
VIQLDQLHKRFGARTAVDDLSFSAHDGQITGLLGPNGAGKTTTLRMLYALLQPDRGRVTVDGIDAALQPLEVRRRLGVLPDARGLYKRLSARENIAYFAQLHGMEPALIRQRSDALIQALAMQDIADRRVEGFSQGERVKTAIARALVHDPRHIVLDEPSNGLDVIATRGLRDFLRQLKSEGRCVLFSTHIMQEVAALCDRIVIIAGGRVVADGTPEALRELAGEHSLEEAFVKLIGGAAVGALA